MTKTVEQHYRVLTDVEHARARPGRYIGSIKPKTQPAWLMKHGATSFVQESTTWNPGLLKLFDEIITNAVDHSKRPEGKHLNTIKVEIDPGTGRIMVWDNGGIPVVKHAEYNEHIPTLIFGFLRSGSNFDDDDQSDGAGQNGETGRSARRPLRVRDSRMVAPAGARIR